MLVMGIAKLLLLSLVMSCASVVPPLKIPAGVFAFIVIDLGDTVRRYPSFPKSG